MLVNSYHHADMSMLQPPGEQVNYGMLNFDSKHRLDFEESAGMHNDFGISAQGCDMGVRDEHEHFDTDDEFERHGLSGEYDHVDTDEEFSWPPLYNSQQCGNGDSGHVASPSTPGNVSWPNLAADAAQTWATSTEPQPHLHSVVDNSPMAMFFLPAAMNVCTCESSAGAVPQGAAPLVPISNLPSPYPCQYMPMATVAMLPYWVRPGFQELVSPLPGTGSAASGDASGSRHSGSHHVNSEAHTFSTGFSRADGMLSNLTRHITTNSHRSEGRFSEDRYWHGRATFSRLEFDGWSSDEDDDQSFDIVSYSDSDSECSLSDQCSDVSSLCPEADCADAKVFCAICLDDCESSDKIRTIRACGHQFHSSCLRMWLMRRRKCPLCRRSIAEHDLQCKF